MERTGTGHWELGLCSNPDPCHSLCVIGKVAFRSFSFLTWKIGLMTFIERTRPIEPINGSSFPKMTRPKA